MDKLDIGELVKSLQDITECPVCLHPLQPETVMCVNGHVMCQGCQGDQLVCPTCRKVFADVQQLTFVQQVLRVVPRQCRFKPCGADVRAEADHEKYCGFRPTKCRVPSCGWEGPCGELEEHFRCKHYRGYRGNLCGQVYTSDKPFNKNNMYLGATLRLLKYPVWVEIKYHPKKDTTFIVSPVLFGKPDSDDTNLVLINIKPVLEIKFTFDNEMSLADNQITVPSTLVRQCYEKYDYRVRIA